mgnify:CR=1 FL=1
MERIICLDNAATSFPKPAVVHETAHTFHETGGVNPGRAGYDTALGAEQMIQGVRKSLSEFFNPSLYASGKDPNRLVFIRNAAMSLNLIINGTVKAGAMPIDMTESNISLLAVTGHEGLLAQSRTGGIRLADDAEIEGTIYGGTGVHSAYSHHLTEFPYRLEAGTLNLAGISAGLGWFEERGVEEIHRHELDLLGKLQDGLREIKGVKLWGTERLDRRVATMSVTVDTFDAEDVGTILDVEYGIQTRTGLHCAPLIHEHYGTVPRGTVRFSCGPFNNERHIEIAVKAMAEIAADRN